MIQLSSKDYAELMLNANRYKWLRVRDGVKGVAIVIISESPDVGAMFFEDAEAIDRIVDVFMSRENVNA